MQFRQSISLLLLLGSVFLGADSAPAALNVPAQPAVGVNDTLSLPKTATTQDISHFSRNPQNKKDLDNLAASLGSFALTHRAAPTEKISGGQDIYQSHQSSSSLEGLQPDSIYITLNDRGADQPGSFVSGF